jgi:uncharacterized protein (TIGR03067 family)
MNDHPEGPQTLGPSAPDVPASPPPLAAPDSRPRLPPAAPPGSPDTRIQGGSIRLFRVAGIDVFLHWSWFFFAFLRLQPTRAGDPFDFVRYDSQLWYVVEYVGLFGLVLLHEFGHVLACRSVGGIANRIVLWPLGGIAFVEPPPRPLAAFWTIAAGPLVNALLLAPTLGFWMACHAAGLQDTAPDLFRFAVAVAWINGYLLLFNLLPLYPLDGGQMLQALLWPVLGRARSLLAATAVGVLTALGMLTFAIVARSPVWGIMAGFGLLFCLIGIQGARALTRMLDAPRRKGVACPVCGAAPPAGEFWACLRCWARLDVFAAGGTCPNCSTPLASVFCPECGRFRPYPEWHPQAIPSEAPAPVPMPAPTEAAPQAPQPTDTARPPTVAQRVVWGTLFAAMALFLCGLPHVEEQPLGLVVWTAGGAILGATSAGALTRTWRTAQARRKLRGPWWLVEVDGQTIPDEQGAPRRLILSGTAYEERVGDRREVRGTYWMDPLADPPAISFTPKTGAGADTPHPGIYRLDGKTLTICLAYPGHPRPTAFLPQPDVQQVRAYRRGGRAGP